MWSKLLGLTPLGALLDWMEAMTYRQGLVGAALGASLTLLHFTLDGPPENGERVCTALLTGAVVGCYWLITTHLGLLNGYARCIRWSGAVLGLFMLAMSLGHDREELTPFLSLLCGVGIGSMAGAILPLAFFRLKGRCEPKCRMRRFALLLAMPSLRFHGDNAASIVSDRDPVETRMLLQEYWGVSDRDELLAVIESLQDEDRLGQTVEVVRWGVTDAMLSRCEGWRILESVGRRATELYTSWDEFAANDPLAEGLCSIESRLLSEPRSPWRRIPWPTAPHIF